MAGRLGTSIELVKASLGVLMQDKKLIIFPLISGVLTLIIIATFIFPFFFVEQLQKDQVLQFVLLFIFYLVSYFIVTFFNVALITCVQARLKGEDASIGDGIANSIRHVGKIFQWAIIGATVGIILRAIESRGGAAGQIGAAIAGGVWSLVTLFVVPVMIFEEKGVFDSIKRSWSIFKAKWGESVIGYGGIGLIFFIIGVIGFIFLVLAFFAAAAINFEPLYLVAIGLFIILIAVLGILVSALHGIFVVVLYNYAKDGVTPPGFRNDLIESSFRSKTQKAGRGNI